MSRRRERHKRLKRLAELNYPTIPGGKEHCFHPVNEYLQAGYRCPDANEFHECMCEIPF